MAEARLLNVNDDEPNRYAVSRVLTKAGFEVVEAATGNEALEKINDLPDLVILDVQLPDVDGFEVARRIRANPATRLIPVLHLSANSLTTHARLRGLEAGADGYLTHPIEPEELVATVRAVLRSRRAERELRLSLEQNSVILQNIADAVTAQDTTGRVVYANDAALRILGYASRDELVSGDAAALTAGFQMLDESGAPFPPEKLPGRLVLDGAPAAEATVRWRRRGSHEDRWTVVQSRPVKDELGRVQLAINILHDITERRRAEQRMMLLNEASAILTSLIDYEETLQRLARLPVPRLADWCVLDVVSAERVRRLVAHADEGKAELAASLAAHEPSLDEPRTLAPSLSTGRAELVAVVDDAMLRARTRDEHNFALFKELGARSLVIAPLTVRGRTFGTLSLLSGTPGRFGDEDLRLAEDLAHRAALAVDNARVFHEAKQAAEVRKELVAVVAHDLKNPLNAIGMAAALLAKQAGTTPEGERIKRQAAIVSRATDRMNRLIHDLLDVAAIDAGALSMERQRVSATALVNEAFETMLAIAQQKPVLLERALPAEELVVAGDRERLLQVLSNLLGNAVKFTPAGGRVTIGAVRKDGAAQFSVADTGPGIERDHLPHVFDRYWRVRKQSRDGTGLGLSIVKGIVDAHGGSVSVDTEPGRGATFTVTIPLAT